MTDKVFFTFKEPWTDKEKGGIQFTKEDIYQGRRTKEGIVVTGQSSFTHVIPWEVVNEQFLNPNKKEK